MHSLCHHVPASKQGRGRIIESKIPRPILLGACMLLHQSVLSFIERKLQRSIQIEVSMQPYLHGELGRFSLPFAGDSKLGPPRYQYATNKAILAWIYSIVFVFRFNRKVDLFRSCSSLGWNSSWHLVLSLRVQEHLGEEGTDHDLVKKTNFVSN